MSERANFHIAADSSSDMGYKRILNKPLLSLLRNKTSRPRTKKQKRLLPRQTRSLYKKKKSSHCFLPNYSRKRKTLSFFLFFFLKISWKKRLIGVNPKTFNTSKNARVNHGIYGCEDTCHHPNFFHGVCFLGLDSPSYLLLAVIFQHFAGNFVVNLSH